jgi:hypothetical protein
LRICTSIGDPHPAWTAFDVSVPAGADRNRDTDPRLVRAFCFVGISNRPFPFREMIAVTLLF